MRSTSGPGKRAAQQCPGSGPPSFFTDRWLRCSHRNISQFPESLPALDGEGDPEGAAPGGMYGTAPEMRSLPVRARMRCDQRRTGIRNGEH